MTSCKYLPWKQVVLKKKHLTLVFFQQCFFFSKKKTCFKKKKTEHVFFKKTLFGGIIFFAGDGTWGTETACEMNCNYKTLGATNVCFFQNSEINEIKKREKESKDNIL